jgi:hypothetical protein
MKRERGGERENSFTETHIKGWKWRQGKKTTAAKKTRIKPEM